MLLCLRRFGYLQDLIAQHHIGDFHHRIRQNTQEGVVEQANLLLGTPRPYLGSLIPRRFLLLLPKAFFQEQLLLLVLFAQALHCLL